MCVVFKVRIFCLGHWSRSHDTSWIWKANTDRLGADFCSTHFRSVKKTLVLWNQVRFSAKNDLDPGLDLCNLCFPTSVCPLDLNRLLFKAVVGLLTFIRF